jgi:hypothetical protein
MRRVVAAKPRYHRLLEDGLALEATLSRARPVWQLAPAISDAELQRLVAAAKLRLSEELVRLYTGVGNGFRSSSVRFPALAELIGAWTRASEISGWPILVPVQEPYDRLLIGFTEDGRTEIWVGARDVIAPDGHERLEKPAKRFDSVALWLEHDLDRDVRELAQLARSPRSSQ